MQSLCKQPIVFIPFLGLMPTFKSSSVAFALPKWHKTGDMFDFSRLHREALSPRFTYALVDAVPHPMGMLYATQESNISPVLCHLGRNTRYIASFLRHIEQGEPCERPLGTDKHAAMCRIVTYLVAIAV
jgi:hypothetical protein